MIKESPTAVGLISPSRLEHNFGINWWGTTNTNMSAPLAASITSGTATYYLFNTRIVKITFKNIQLKKLNPR